MPCGAERAPQLYAEMIQEDIFHEPYLREDFRKQSQAVF
jgi:hypothetical protein